MHINNIKLLSLSLLLLSSTAAFADKPSWAGNGGKPSNYEKREHKEDMTSKHKQKKQKKHDKHSKHKKDGRSDRDYDRDYDRNHDNDRGYVKYKEDRDYSSRDSYRGDKYEGQGMSNSEFIDEKKDETQKNWIGKFFDFLN